MLFATSQPEPLPGGRRPWLPVLWILAFAVSFLWVIQHRWIGDDIFITFRYCDNLLDGLGPVYNAGERSEGYTHFLWFILLTIGRALHIDAQTLGTFLPMPFYLAALALLVLISSRLFPQRGGLWGIPLAALAWAAHEDVRYYASSGLETAFFISALLLGFYFLAASRHRRRHVLGAWAYAIASLARPDGMLFSGFAVLFALWRWGWRSRRFREFLGLYVLLVAPLFVFRLLYYGYPFPNPYYAKSGGLSNWPQGWAYLRTYFGAYLVLILAPLAAIPMLRHWRESTAGPDAPERPVPALAMGLVAALASIFYVTRVGGDFMYARFYLPATPFLLLCLEWLVQSLRRFPLRLAASLTVVGLMLFGAVRKHSWLSDKRHVRSIVDEPQWYPNSRFEINRAMADAMRRCFEGTHAVIMVQGGQANLAYFAKFPVALERYGLTDVHIAHSPAPPIRGRPGHEKLADAQYIYDRGVNLRFHHRPAYLLEQYVQFALPWKSGYVYGDIIVYDRELMEQLKKCSGVRFLDFPIWLQYEYIPKIGSMRPDKVARDYNQFQRYYFEHNPDPEGLLAKLDAAMQERGIAKIPQEPLRPDYFADTGQTTMPGGLPER